MTTQANKSLERTTAESAIFHSQMLGGRRSAIRSAPLKAEDRALQMSAFDGRDSSNLVAQFRSLLSSGVRIKRRLTNSQKYLRRLSAGTWGTSTTTVHQGSHDVMSSRRFPAPMHAAEPNKSLERTTAESAIFHSQLSGGRRSAHRWASLKAKD